MKPAFYELDAEKPFTTYVLEKSIKAAEAEIRRINEELRLSAKKGVHWDEFHGMMIRQVFELRRVVEAFYCARESLQESLIEYLEVMPETKTPP